MNVIAFEPGSNPGKDNPVIVADDDPAQVLEISEYLKRRGIDVVAAFDGESAIAAIETHRPAVALIDVNMPGWDGIRVAEIVSHLDPKLALILMSGDSEAIVRANHNHEGAFAVIEKPLAMNHVGHFIEAALLRYGADC